MNSPQRLGFPAPQEDNLGKSPVIQASDNQSNDCNSVFESLNNICRSKEVYDATFIDQHVNVNTVPSYRDWCLDFQSRSGPATRHESEELEAHNIAQLYIFDKSTKTKCAAYCLMALEHALGFAADLIETGVYTPSFCRWSTWKWLQYSPQRESLAVKIARNWNDGNWK